jgi:hypothetical protein
MKKTAHQRDEYIKTLEEELRKLRITTKQELEIFAEEMKTKGLEDQHKAQCLTLERDRLQDQLNIYKFYERENKSLRDTIKNLQGQVERVNKISNIESEKSVVEMENWKRQLELDYQLRAQENQANAYLDLDATSRDAVETTHEMHDQLKKQNVGLEDMLSKLRLMQNEHQRLKISSRASERENMDKEEQIRALHDQILHSQEKMLDLEDTLQNQRSERLSYELLLTEMEAMNSELAKMGEKYEKAKKDVEKWRTRALALKHVDESNLTPRVMNTLIKKRDEILQSARKTSKEAETTDREVRIGSQLGQISSKQALSIWNSGFTSNYASNPYYDNDPVRQKRMEEQKQRIEDEMTTALPNVQEKGRESVFKVNYDDESDGDRTGRTDSADSKKRGRPRSLKSSTAHREEQDAKLSVMTKGRHDKKFEKNLVKKKPDSSGNNGLHKLFGAIQNGSGALTTPFTGTSIQLSRSANGAIVTKGNTVKLDGTAAAAPRFLVP